jgi:hypothetical protein
MPKLGHFAASGRFFLQQGYPSRVAESVYFHSLQLKASSRLEIFSE